MKRLALLFCLFSTVLSTYVLACEAALMHFDQQLKALTATRSSHAHGGASIESKIKELEQLLIDLLRERKSVGARKWDDFQKDAQKRFVTLFNQLMGATLGKGLELSREQKEQLIKITKSFDTAWPSGSHPLTFPELLVTWDHQRQARQTRTSVAGASTMIVQTVRNIVGQIGSGVQQGLQTLQAGDQKAKEKAVVAQAPKQAEVVRPVVAQPVAKKEEEEKKRELLVAQPVLQERKQEAAEQEKKSKEEQQEQEKKVVAAQPVPSVLPAASSEKAETSVFSDLLSWGAKKVEKLLSPEEAKKTAAQPISVIASPVAIDPEVAKQLTALEELLKTYKSDLAHALKAKASQENKNKLFKQLKSSFLAQYKALKEYEKAQGHALAPEQEKQLKEIVKDYDEETQIFVATNR